MFSDLLMIWSDQPGITLGVWLVVLITVLYLARLPAHQMLKSTGRMLYRFMRSASRGVTNIERQAINRNKEVILAQGREATEKVIEREFTRVSEIVAKDLSRYPVLHRKLSDVIDQLEKDYESSTDTPPLPPEWLSVVQTISELPKQSDPLVSDILENIKEKVVKAHEETLKAYQKATGERHDILAGMQSKWRSLSGKMDKTQTAVSISQERAEAIDRHMEMYKAIRDGEDKAARALTASSLTQFFIAGLVLFVAVMGGLINFQLIAMPMSEMVGGSSYIGSLKTSNIAALVIILIEIAMGLFLLESLRITKLFSVIGHMDDKMRKRMMLITFSILFILACIEASLAYMRDLLALDREALKQSLIGSSVLEAEFRWIPSIGQMVMGFVLPFALSFVAIPLESFIHSSRTVLGVISVAVLRVIAIALRLIGGTANQLCKIAVYLYDMVISVPLAIEKLIRHAVRSRTRAPGKQKTEPASAEDSKAMYVDETGKKPAKKTARKSRRDTELSDDDLAFGKR
ncbi:MAG: hypothetical protein KZQ80_16140 [Candidatus Thiodiazotropha sp. (ex Monitilora ramsayi)]|nr:hypothetical protein [Candidatus Thiodiazotropha sp. (ex Monitilora ramsayi)]